MKYLVVIEKTDNGFSAYVPDLPGCITVGDTREETEGLIQEAIIFHLEGLKEDGFTPPIAKSEGLTMILPQAV